MRKNIISGIYCIENIVTNKKYIGQSVNINDRWCKHRTALNHGNHDNDYLQKAWDKYGEANFEFYILERCNSDKLDEREIYYIELHNTLNRDCGYNLKSGGQSDGIQASDYVKNKISKALKKSYSENEDFRKQQRNNALKQWANPDIKAKILGENNGMYGKHHTEDARKRMSEKRKGKPSKKRNNIPVFCVELNREYENATIASKELGIYSNLILQVCYGKRKTTGGYHWKFLSENNIS